MTPPYIIWLTAEEFLCCNVVRQLNKMRTASKLLIMFCLMSKKAKGSLGYSSLEEAMHAFRTNALGSEELLNSEEFSYSDKSKSEEPFNYDEASKSKEAPNSSEKVYQYSKMTRHLKSRSRSKSVSSERAYRVGASPSFGKEMVKATSMSLTFM